MSKMQLNEMGKVKANRYADPNSSCKFDECPCVETPICQDKIEHTLTAAEQTGTVVNAMFGGEVYTPTTPFAPTDTDAWENFLETVFNDRENHPYCKATLNGADLQLLHVGGMTLENVVINNGTADVTLAAVRCCTFETVYKFATYLVDGPHTLTYTDPNGNVTTGNLTGPYPYAGDPVTDAATAATLATDLAAALTAMGVPSVRSAAVVDDANSGFEIQVWSAEQLDLKIGSVLLSNCGSAGEFTC